MPIPKVILLDVYETLLDMRPVEKKVNALTDSIRGYTIWFELFMQYCFVDNCTVQFHEFSSIARATLQMAGRMLGRNLTDEQVEDVLALLKGLPVHDGVPAGLSCLRDMGFQIAALTNSPEKTVYERMERSGLISYFETVLSAEHVKKYKPCTDVYEWAAGKMQTPVHEILMVSSHGWDVAGAANAGLRTAYIRQDKQLLYPLAPAPDFVAAHLEDLCQQLKALQEKS